MSAAVLAFALKALISSAFTLLIAVVGVVFFVMVVAMVLGLFMD